MSVVLVTLMEMVRLGVTPLVIALLSWVGLCVGSSAGAEAADRDALARRLLPIEGLVERAIARGELPGCVVAVGTRKGALYTRAFGTRTQGEPMTIDTLFDLASLTKPMATASSIALLASRGALTLDTPAARLLRELDVADKRRITLRQLLLHTSGLANVGPLWQVEGGAREAPARIAAQPLRRPPGRAFEYSDLGYILLGEVVARASGRPLDAFVQRELFAPLGMTDTHFLISPAEIARTAPTELRGDALIRGVVDDPRAFRLGGVAGNAGLFSTAGDVGRFARMLLNRGELDGVRVLAADSVDAMLRPTRAGSFTRTPGWDVQSPWSQGRARLYSQTAVGHGGYTGTSLWVDRAQDLYVVVLSNRVHAGARGTLHPLASSVGDIAVRALVASRAEDESLRTGIDVLREEAFARVRGRRVAVLTHDAARDSTGASTLERIVAAPQVDVRAILTPEHGLSARYEGKVADQRYRGLAVHSLFGKTRRPSAQMLAEVELVLVDLVDVGTRFYTYMATVLATLEVAGELGLPVLLLDRPNPIDGVHVEGPLSEATFASFVNYQPLPLRHGMSAGELARYLIAARGLKTRLEVVQVEGWQRTQGSAELARPWSAPSPNLGSAEQALLYPATALVEGTNVSVGRGTPHAFRVVGAPFVDAQALVTALQADSLRGVRVSETRFRPSVGPYAGQTIPGVRFRITDLQAYSAAHTGLSLIRALRHYLPRWDDARLPQMLAHRATLEALSRGEPTTQIANRWKDELAIFMAERARVLLY